MSFKYIFFDVAQTLLHKPLVFEKINTVLSSFGYKVEPELLKRNHKLLSEAIKFPDKTSGDFYRTFNAELLYSLGIIPDDDLLDAIFKSCTYLPWEKFDDTVAINDLTLPVGIISNWDITLEEKLKTYFDLSFFRVIVSQKAGVAKPSPLIFEYAIKELDCKPEEIIFVGDSLKLDIEPALKKGLTAVLIDRGNFFPAFKGLKISSLHELKKLTYAGK